MGLLGTMARTAAVAGTAQAVRGRVARRQAENFADRDADIARDRAQAYAQQAPPAPAAGVTPGAAAPSTSTSTSDTLAQLKQLGELRDSGVLTDDEFQTQKAKILGER
jgi:hypothetical protein